ncbi:MAG TPA: hypothetical protein VHH36_08560 [Candidatus Thermoplasmatota archaeon]|nr:hypothetical protein [Candidatus Thermoplasmatota archaeon]
MIPHDVLGMYALALALRLGGREILLAGFDGVPLQGAAAGSSVPLEQLLLDREMAEFFDLLGREPRVASGEVTITSLTPTSYPVAQGSLYARLP